MLFGGGYDTQNRRRRRRRRQRRRRRSQQNKMEERLASNPEWAFRVLLVSPERRQKSVPYLSTTYGAWAVEHSKEAALLVVSRPELHDERHNGLSLLTQACQSWEAAARTVWEEKPELMKHDTGKSYTLAHVLVREWPDLARKAIMSPSRAMTTFGEDQKPIIFSALAEYESVAEEVFADRDQFGGIADEQNWTVEHSLARQRAEFALALIQDPRVRHREDENGRTVLEVALRRHPNAILEAPGLAELAPEGQDPLVHQIMDRVGRDIYGWKQEQNIKSKIRDQKEWLALPNQQGTPLLHRHIEVFGHQALADPELGNLTHPRIDGETARMAALKAHPGPINALRAVRNKWQGRNRQARSV